MIYTAEYRPAILDSLLPSSTAGYLLVLIYKPLCLLSFNLFI